MGGFFSSESAPPQSLPSLPSPLLTTPWREISWGNTQEPLQYMKNFQPQNEKVEAIRVLLCGPVGAGRSSFINSVNSVLRGRMTHEALASPTCDSCFTKTYQTYKIKKEGRGNFYPFVFNDVMGLVDGDGRGVRTDDIKLALKGHVKDGYEFKSSASISVGDPCYNAYPSLRDRVHVLVYMISAHTPQMMSSILKKMTEVRKAARDLGIYQLAILTHIDEACGEIEKNIRNVYKSKHLKKKMTDFSSSLGIPMNCIFPVKNYSEEIQLDPDVDALILSALRLMIDFGGNYATNNQHFVPAMGGGSPGLLETPWRDISSTNKHELLQFMNNFQPQNEKVKAVRVLLYGPVGAGKSSFINSVNNILQGRMTNEALASSITSDQSFTKKYKTYEIKKEGKRNFYPFVFNDIMGLEEGQGRGVRTDDIKLALKGRVNEGYKFNPASSLSDDDLGYNSSPSISDRVHVLVCVYSANASEMRSSVLQKMREIREAASDLDIPQLAILTLIDEACGETQRDLKNIYRSKYLKKKMGDFSSSLGIPMNCILPVKNYSHETQLNPDIDTLILSALKMMINFGDDYADKL